MADLKQKYVTGTWYPRSYRDKAHWSQALKKTPERKLETISQSAKAYKLAKDGY